jgi:hypothetical protein
MSVKPWPLTGPVAPPDWPCLLHHSSRERRGNTARDLATPRTEWRTGTTTTAARQTRAGHRARWGLVIVPGWSGRRVLVHKHGASPGRGSRPGPVPGRGAPAGGRKRRADTRAGVGTKAHRGNSRGVRWKLSRHIFPTFHGDLAGQEAFHGVQRFAPCSDPAAPPASLAVTFCKASPVNLWDGVLLFLDSRQRHQLSRLIFPSRHSGPLGCSESHGPEGRRKPRPGP